MDSNMFNELYGNRKVVQDAIDSQREEQKAIEESAESNKDASERK